MTEATGGIISYAGGKKIHTFTTSGVLSVTEAGNVESLVVAGGGGGYKGGGGGGGVIYTASLPVVVGNVTITVGDGGTPGLTGSNNGGSSIITDGNISFTTQTAIGGGKGGGNGGDGKAGGSGGGGGPDGGTAGGAGTVGQGYAGGTAAVFAGGGGGGGAGAVGGDADVPFGPDGGGDGGLGFTSSISGSSRAYGGGGGGQGDYGTRVPFGSSGGGNGANNVTGVSPSNGTANTGGGGGGGGGTVLGLGGSGVVIFSYDSDFTTGRRVAQNEDLADMTASTIKGRITSTGIPQDLNATQVAGILDTEITERAQDAMGAMVADTATIDLTYTDATPALTADVRVDSINDTHIDWGTGANQVNLDDVPDGSTYVRITATNHTDLTDGGSTSLHTHATDHARQHSITSTSDHTSTATSGQILKADTNGLPVNATNTDAQVSAAVTASHAAATVADSASIDLTLTGQQISAAAIFGTSAGVVAEGNHAHSGTYQPLDSDLTSIAGLSPANDDIIQRKAGVWINRTIAQLVTDIRTVIDSVFAPIAKGVTNGDSHDHSGGDGAQIAHTGLSSIGTNTHAQIDTHIASTSNPHSVTAAQAGAVELVSGNANIASGKTYNINGSPLAAGDVGAVPNDGWIAVTGTWTYASASTITIPSDGTTVYQKSMKIRFKQGGGFKYAVAEVVAATLITILVNTDYTVANAAITDVSYSFVEAPYGWPSYFNFATTVTSQAGSLTSYTVNSATYKPRGTAIKLDIDVTITNNGTGAGAIVFIPPTPNTTPAIGQGRENALTGLMLQVQWRVGFYPRIFDYANGYPGGTNAQVIASVEANW